MWVFLPGGLLMPAALPNMADDNIEVDPKWTHDGKFDLQVRARVKRHLENFIGEFMADGTYSDIQATPNMDYNFRFYTTRDDFAWAMGKAIAAIDYQKFKPTAERKNVKGTLMYGPESPEYHSVLNAMWGTVTKLGSPGGVWGTFSKTNPTGYKPKGKYSGYSGGAMGDVYAKGESGWGKVEKIDYGTKVTRGIDFGDDAEADIAASAVPEVGTPEFDVWWEQVNKRIDPDPDYDREYETEPVDPADRDWWRENLLEEANLNSIPLEDWRSYFTAAEFDILRNDYEGLLKARRDDAKRNRKQRRKQRAKVLRGL